VTGLIVGISLSELRKLGKMNRQDVSVVLGLYCSGIIITAEKSPGDASMCSFLPV
jgi:hypothetical protein